MFLCAYVVKGIQTETLPKFPIMPVSYMVYGSFTLLAIALLIYLFSLKKRR